MYCNVILVGNCGDTPTMRITPGGQAVTQFSLAVNRRWKDRDSGEQREETTWTRVSCWGRLAELVNEHVRKGRLVLVEADRIEARAYLKDGEARASLEVTARDVRFLGKRDDGEAFGG